jgi:hypothetical protein
MAKGYSSESSFQFDIERWKDLKTQQLHSSVPPEMECQYEWQAISLTVKGRYSWQPGRHYHPEHSFPEEMDVDLDAVIGPDGKDWEGVLTTSERDQILRMIEDEVTEQMDDYDPYDNEDDYIEDLADSYDDYLYESDEGF